MIPEVHIAQEDMPTRCILCVARIDKGDQYVIVPWPGGFDYVHRDCNETSMLRHVRGEAS